MEKLLFGLANVTKLAKTSILLLLLVLPCTCSQLPLLLTFSGDLLRRVTAVATAPLFIFLLTNAIVLSLLAKYSPQSPDLEEYSIVSYYKTEDFSPPPPEDEYEEEIVYQNKEMVADSPSGEGVLCDHVAAEEEELSSEEFKRAVEEFIAKQMRFHHLEMKKKNNMAVVVAA